MNVHALTSASAERSVRDLLERADIRIGGKRPWDISVHDDRFYARVLAHGPLGLGEAYMDGLWDCDHVDAFIFHALRNGLGDHMPHDLSLLLSLMAAKVMNLQTESAARRDIHAHYDLGNDFFAAMLDPRMQYSCGYFDGTDDLALAQERKLDLIARKLGITSKDHVLDVGCGWGGLAKFLAQRFGCRVTGVTIAREQVSFARESCRGLPVEILECDYREVTGTFSKIVSVGMFEHVGAKNHRTYFEAMHERLADGGLFLLHTIGASSDGFMVDPWINRYIFPHAEIPSMPQITSASDRLFIAEDWHNFGAHYDKTLQAWHKNFTAAWPRFRTQFDARFFRMWSYYLLSCAGSFRARNVHLWQIVLSKRGIVGGYTSVR